MWFSNTPVMLIIIGNLVIPLKVQSRSIYAIHHIRTLHAKRQSTSAYSWEQSWKTETDNEVTTTTTSTSGNIPANLGITQAIPNTWSYSYSYAQQSTSESGTEVETSNSSTSLDGDGQAQAIQQDQASNAPTIMGLNHESPKISPPDSSTSVGSIPEPSKISSPGMQRHGVEIGNTNLPLDNPSVSTAGTPSEKDIPARLNSHPLPTGNRSSNSTGITSSQPLPHKKSSNDSPGNHKQAWLESHNSYRLQYGVGSVTWSEDLVDAAKIETDRCIWKHTSNNKYGENIAAGQNSASEVVIAWVEGPNEREIWNPSAPTFTHFTQVVWKETMQIGCASTTCENVQGANLPQSPVILWACEYHPRGNVQGEYTKNVLAAAGGQPLASTSTMAFASVDPGDPSKAKAGSGAMAIAKGPK